MKFIILFSSLLLICSCQNEALLPLSNQKTDAISERLSFSEASFPFTSGILEANQVIPASDLLPTGGLPGGNAILADNSPEIIYSEGWVFAPPRINNVRQSVTGEKEFYTFHYNKMKVGGVEKNAFYVLLATNPNSTPVTASLRGSILTKTDAGGFNFSNPPYFFEKEGFEVSKRFLEGDHNYVTSNVSIPPSGAGNFKILAYKYVAQGDGVDGRFTLNFSNNVFVYAVMVSINQGESVATILNRAVNLATTDNFTASNVNKRADGEWKYNNDWILERPDEYGRQSGLYRNSKWEVNQTITLPQGPGYLGMCLISDKKFNAFSEDQTSEKIALVPADTRRYSNMGSLENASRTYGNYGYLYDMTYTVVNNEAITRNVKLSMACTVTDANAPNARYVGYVKVKDGYSDEVPVNCIVRLNDPKFTLLNFTCAPNSSKIIKLRFYVPGLITAGNGLILEVLN
jgi:hypothetical protein